MGVLGFLGRVFRGVGIAIPIATGFMESVRVDVRCPWQWPDGWRRPGRCDHHHERGHECQCQLLQQFVSRCPFFQNVLPYFSSSPICRIFLSIPTIPSSWLPSSLKPPFPSPPRPSQKPSNPLPTHLISSKRTELVQTEEEDGLVDLEAENLRLNKAQRLAVDLDEALALLAVRDGSGGLLLAEALDRLNGRHSCGCVWKERCVGNRSRGVVVGRLALNLRGVARSPIRNSRIRGAKPVRGKSRKAGDSALRLPQSLQGSLTSTSFSELDNNLV